MPEISTLGMAFMDNIRVRLHNNLLQRLKTLEKSISQILPAKDFLYPLEDGDAFFARNNAYLAAFNSRSDVEMAETLWSYLANAEVRVSTKFRWFRISESENLFLDYMVRNSISKFVFLDLID